MSARRYPSINEAVAAVRVAIDTDSIHFLFADVAAVDAFFLKVHAIDKENGWRNLRSRRRVMSNLASEACVALRRRAPSMMGGL